MKNKKRKTLVSLISALLIMSSFSSVCAEDLTETDITRYPTIDRETANLTIRYFDDSDEQIPITGAEFTVMKVADIGRDITDGTNGRYLAIDDAVDFSNLEEKNEDDAFAYEAKVVKFYEENPNAGYKKVMTINEKGTATATLPVGAYLVTETKVTRYHVKSKPFLVSVPETNEESNSWNFDVVVNPKQIIAGDLSITKQILGKSSKKSDLFHIKVELGYKGAYKALLADGTTKEVTNGDILNIKADEKIVIYDIPAGTTFKVTEVEENKDPYKTGYKNQTGKIEPKTEVQTTVINDTTPWDNVHTGEGAKVIIAMMIFGGALAMLIFILAKSKQNKKS